MADIKSQLSALVKRDLEEDDAEDFELPIPNASDLEKVNSAISTSKKAYKILVQLLYSLSGFRYMCWFINENIFYIFLKTVSSAG